MLSLDKNPLPDKEEPIDKKKRLELIELPAEVLHLVLFQAALGRGVKRALRLRLVCKTFADAVHPALFETHLLDNQWCLRSYAGSYGWQLEVGSKYGADKLFHKYLVYRVMDGRDKSEKHFVRMRQYMQIIRQELERERKSAFSLREVAEGLCLLVLTKGKGVRDYEGELKMMGKVKSETRTSLGLNLLSAAAYFNLLPLAKRLVAEGHNPRSHAELFAPPIQIAAQTGNITMLQFFQEQLPRPTLYERFSVTGAAIRGDIDILKLALRHLPSTEDAGDGESDDSNGQQYGAIEYNTLTGHLIIQARKYTSNIEVYEYLTSAFARPAQHAFYACGYRDLENHAQLGNMTMVRYLLDHGVPVQERSVSFESPLIMACRGLREDIVDLLLERGADPNFVPQKLYPKFPLHESATAGSLSIARKLLDHGANIDRPDQCAGWKLPILWWAFAREHTDMIQLVRERGAVFGERRIGGYLATMFYYFGYESMAEMLQREYGYQAVEPVFWPRGDSGWKTWNEAKVVPFSRRLDRKAYEAERLNCLSNNVSPSFNRQLRKHQTHAGSLARWSMFA